MTATGGLSAATASIVAATAAAPAMSDFISHMPGGRLDGEAAGVEGDALADQRHRRRSAPRRRVGRAGPAGAAPPSPGRPRGCRRTRPCAAPLVEHLDSARPPGAAAATASAKCGGRSSLGAVLTQSRARADRPSPRRRPALQRALAALSAASGTCTDRRRAPAGRLGFDLYPVEPVAAEQRALGERPQHVASVVVRQRQGQRDRGAAGQRADRGAGRRGAASPVGGRDAGGSGPRPTATTSGAVIAPRVASLVTSPAAPVAPSSASVSVSLPSNAAAMLSAPAASSSGAGSSGPGGRRRSRSRRRPARPGRCRPG